MSCLSWTGGLVGCVSKVESTSVEALRPLRTVDFFFPAPRVSMVPGRRQAMSERVNDSSG